MLSTKTPFLSTTAMRAIVVSNFGGPEVLEIKRNVPIPKVHDGEVLVKVAAAGVNPVDTYIRSGNYANLPMLPYIPGGDVCGTVVQVGSGVKKFQEGDRVCSYRTVSGAYAEFTTVNHNHLVKLTDDYDFIQGAGVGTPYFTAYRALFQNTAIKAGQTILIHGASGGVGVAAVQMALCQGMTVYGTAGTEEGMTLVKKLGVKHVFNHREEGYAKNILNATNGKGLDVIVEILSNVNLARDLELVAPKGTILVIGCRGPIEINPRLLMKKESKLQGVMLTVASNQEILEATAYLEAGLQRGILDPVIGLKYSLNDVQQAHKDIIHNTGSKGKMVLVI